MKHYRLITILVCFTISFCTNALAYKANDDRFNVRVAVVDVQSTLENSLAVQSIRESVYQVNEKIQQDMSDKLAEFKKIEATIFAKRSSISDEEFEKEVLRFEKAVNLVKKKIQDRKMHLERTHAEAMAKVYEAAINIISNLAEKHNINLVIPNTQILFAKSTLNMTAEVIIELNNKLKTVKMKYEL
jgi:Skp family chaperone for outer membrane proteins